MKRSRRIPGFVAAALAVLLIAGGFLWLLAFRGMAEQERRREFFEVIRQGKTERVVQELANGADPNWRLADSEQTSVPVWQRMTRLLQFRAADALAPTALDVALKQGRSEIVRVLVEAGADVNAQSRERQYHDWNTPLFAAVDGRFLDTAGFLIDRGADVNCGMNGSLTPLYLASMRVHPEAVKLLLARGADPNLATRLGMTPLSMTREFLKSPPPGDSEKWLDQSRIIERMLLAAGARQ